MKKQRYEYIILTITSFLVDIVIFGFMSVNLLVSNIAISDIQNPILAFVFVTISGRYFF